MARQHRFFSSVGSEMSALHPADYPNPHRARRYASVLALALVLGGVVRVAPVLYADFPLLWLPARGSVRRSTLRPGLR